MFELRAVEFQCLLQESFQPTFILPLDRVNFCYVHDCLDIAPQEKTMQEGIPGQHVDVWGLRTLG